MKKENMPSDSSVPKKTAFTAFIKEVRTKTSLRAEISVGLSTAMVSIFAILGGVKLISNSISQNESLFFMMAVLALVISGLLTIFSSFYTRVPLVFTLSIGVNSVLTAFILTRFNLDWSVALGLLLLESILFALLVLSPFPKKFLSHMPEFFHYAWPACLGGILISLAFVSGKLISFQGSSHISLMTFSQPQVFLFFIGTIGAFLLFRQKQHRFLGFIPLFMALFAMIIPSLAGPNMNKGIIIGGIFFVAWLLLYSILIDARKKHSLNISLSLWALGLILSIAFSDKIPDAIMTAPFQWFGESGIMHLPSIAYLKEILGFPFLSLGNVFKQLNALWSVLFSVLIVHFLTSWALIATLRNSMKDQLNSPSSVQVAEKRYFAIESASSIISAQFCLGGGTYSIGTIFSYIFGAKTIFSSLVCGISMLLAVFFLPFAYRYLNLYTISPLLFIGGAWLIYHSFKHWLEKREDLIPLLIVFLAGILTWNLYFAFLAGLLAYVLDRLSTKRNKEIHSWVWASLILLLIFAFIFTPISFIHFTAY